MEAGCDELSDSAVFGWPGKDRPSSACVECPARSNIKLCDLCWLHALSPRALVNGRLPSPLKAGRRPHRRSLCGCIACAAVRWLACAGCTRPEIDEPGQLAEKLSLKPCGFVSRPKGRASRDSHKMPCNLQDTLEDTQRKTCGLSCSLAV